MSNNRMRKWTDAKLDKELAFARAARDETHPENMRWLAQLLAEDSRRANLAQPCP